MGCSRQEYWNGFSASNPGMEPAFLCLLHWQVGSLPLTTPGKPHMCVCMDIYRYACMCAKSLQLCLILCGLINCNPPGSSVHGILQARILEWVGLPWGIFLTQGSNPGLLYCRQILYHLSHQGSSIYICIYSVIYTYTYNSYMYIHTHIYVCIYTYRCLNIYNTYINN